MRAAEEGAGGLDTVTNDPTPAMITGRRQLVDGALEAIEDVPVAGRDHLERQVVVVPTHLTFGHGSPRGLESEDSAAKPVHDAELAAGPQVGN